MAKGHSVQHGVISAVSAGKEILWFCNLFTKFGFSFPHVSVLYIDNESALSVAQNLEHHGHIKHLDLCLYWLCDEVEKEKINIVHLQTEDMLADALRKELEREKLKHIVMLLGHVLVPP